MRTTIFIYLMTIVLLANAQDVTRVSKSSLHWGEIYYVLKTDKSAKHGQYLKYFESMNAHDKAIESYGSYENNKRSGAWMFCDPEALTNPLISIGEYKEDEKTGTWIYFYGPGRYIKDFSNLVNSRKQTQVELPSKGNEHINVTLDTTGVKTAVMGNYSGNKKIGIWSYYYPNGILACQYDFTKDSMIRNNGLTSYEQLGGIERFAALFHKALFEKAMKNRPFYVVNSDVSFEIITNHDSVDIIKTGSNGSIAFTNAIETVLHKMSSDWINYDPRFEKNKIKIKINYVVSGNKGEVSLDTFEPTK